MKQFEDKMLEMSKDYEQAKEIIRRYDEILAEKASKTSVKEIYEHFNIYVKETPYTEFKALNLQKFSKLDEDIKKLNDLLQTLNENIGKDIFAAVRRATASLQKNNNNTSNVPNALIGVDGTEIKGLLMQKADRKELDALNDLKSNKVDTEQTMKAIDILHKQITHIIVLFIESVKASIKNHVDNKKALQKKRMYVLQQAVNVCQWVH